MVKPKRYSITLDDVKADSATEDVEGFRGVDIRWLVTDETFGTNHSCLFRCIFHKGAYHKPHWHPKTDEYVYSLRGNAVQWIDGKLYPMLPGTMLYIPKNVVHWMLNEGDEDAECIGFYPDVRSYVESGFILADDPAQYGFPHK